MTMAIERAYSIVLFDGTGKVLANLPPFTRFSQINSNAEDALKTDAKIKMEKIWTSYSIANV